MANTISFGRRSITIVPDGATDFNIATMQANKFLMTTQTGDFAVGETVTQATSNATGVVRRWDKPKQILYLDSMTGTFDATHAVTGGTSSAHGIPVEVLKAFPNGIRLSDVRFHPSGTTDLLIIRERLATGPILYKNGIPHQGVEGRSLRIIPYIKASEQAFLTPATCVIILEYD